MPGLQTGAIGKPFYINENVKVKKKKSFPVTLVLKPGIIFGTPYIVRKVKEDIVVLDF